MICPLLFPNYFLVGGGSELQVGDVTPNNPVEPQDIINRERTSKYENERKSKRIDFYIWGFCDSVPNPIWICVDLPLQ